MTRFNAVLAASVFALVGAAPLSAQTSCTANPCTIQVSASATVSDVLEMTLSSTATNLGAPTAADFTTGYKEAAGPTATVKANRPWHIDVVANNPAKFTYAGSLTDPNKPASDLEWGLVAGTYPNTMATSAVLKSGATGTTGTSQQIFFKTLWSWANDVPGSYSLVLDFTLAAP